MCLFPLVLKWPKKKRHRAPHIQIRHVYLISSLPIYLECMGREKTQSHLTGTGIGLFFLDDSS